MDFSKLKLVNNKISYLFDKLHAIFVWWLSDTILISKLNILILFLK